MPDRILLLTSSTTYRADAFIDAARRMGVEVVLASNRCQVLAKSSPQAERGAVPLDFDDPDAAVAAIVAIARSDGSRFSAIVATDDTTTILGARASEAIGLPSNPVAAVTAAKDKRRLREALSRAGLPCPRFRTVDLDSTNVRAIADEVEYPVVLKPAALAASQGVIRADDAGELGAAFERVGRLLRSPDVAVRRDPALECVIVEEFIPGVEVAVEGLLVDGRLRVLALFDKPDPLDGPFFEETIYVTPSRLPPASQDAIARATADAARALGLREGPIHAELRVNDRGPFVIELAARSIGGLCSRTLRFGAGVSLEEVIIAHALGRGDVLERERRPAGVMMIPIPRRGFLRGVGGQEDARAVPGVEDVTITHGLSEVIPLPEGDCYLGFIFARGETPEAVESALREAHRRLRFDITSTLPAVDVRERRER